ncbi:MAG: putative glycoside hydrolase [Methanobacteriaceae archaeon]|nr:putative glycoside hydrolase [Methanobacteriaceae archaeon]
MILGLNSGCVAAAGNFTTTKAISINEVMQVPYTSTVTSWYNIPLIENGFIVGIFINPRVTPISEINFTALKSAGITDIYVLVTNDNYLSVLSQAKTKADTVGIKTNAWVYPGFSHAAQVAHMKIGVLLDVETHNMSAYVSQIKDMRLATKGVTFYICVKPELWDGNQYYFLIAPYCDYIVPMLYKGDYGQGITGLRNWVKVFNFIYPRKIIAGLETYQSDKNLTPKSASTILAEIKAVQPNTHGVILFRHGLSNFNG